MKVSVEAYSGDYGNEELSDEFKFDTEFDSIQDLAQQINESWFLKISFESNKINDELREMLSSFKKDITKI